MRVLSLYFEKIIINKIQYSIESSEQSNSRDYYFDLNNRDYYFGHVGLFHRYSPVVVVVVFQLFFGCYWYVFISLNKVLSCWRCGVASGSGLALHIRVFPERHHFSRWKTTKLCVATKYRDVIQQRKNPALLRVPHIKFLIRIYGCDLKN